MSRARQPGSLRGSVLNALEAAPHLSIEMLASRIGRSRREVAKVIQDEGLLVGNSERPCGNPAAHDEFLALLRAAHPDGFEDRARSA